MDPWWQREDPAMGQLIDQWLIDLKTQGLSSRERHRLARRLGRVASVMGHSTCARDRILIEEFENWIQRNR